MILENIFDNIVLLEAMQAVLFVTILMVSSSYLIPKGIVLFLEWKEKKTFRILSTSVTYCCLGVFLLLYLLLKSVIK